MKCVGGRCTGEAREIDGGEMVHGVSDASAAETDVHKVVCRNSTEEKKNRC